MSHLIDFVLFPNALGLDITGPLEVFNTATQLLRLKGGSGGYRARFAAAKKGPVRLSSGLEVIAQSKMGDGPAADILLIPGGIGANDAVDNDEFIARVREGAQKAARIVSVCSGAFILAAAGLLDGRRATTHWRVSDDLIRQYPKVNVVPDAIFTRDGNVYTSAGVTAGIDLALALVEEDLGGSIAIEVSRMLVLYFRRPGTQSQFSAPLKSQEAAGERFASLHAWLLEHIDETVSVETMADRVSMSPRNFSRVFKAGVGMTPGRYVETLRLDRARELLAAGDDTLETVAEASGFGREERLRRAFMRRYNITPAQYRLHFSKRRAIRFENDILAS